MLDQYGKACLTSFVVMLKPCAPDLWTHEFSIRIHAGFFLPVRSTIVRLPGGELVIHSPPPIDDALAAAITELGPVGHLVAPSLLHHLYVGPALERFPTARVHAPASLASKRPDLRIDAPLSERDPQWPTLIPIAIAGAPTIDEFVFVHTPSCTLLVTDLVFNIHATQGLLTPLILRMVGAHNRLAQSRIWRVGTRDRPAARASVERIFSHDFTRVIPAHGDVLDGPDSAERLRAALAWMLTS